MQTSEFLMAFAHDLRQPLRSILMVTQRLQRGSGELSPEMRTRLDEIGAAARRQDELIAGAVEYEQALQAPASGEISLALRLAIQTACMKVEAFRHARKGLIHFDAHQVPQVFAPSGLARLLEKVLHNSLKFQLDGASPVIEITATEVEGGMVEVRVSDNGLGIQSQYRESVFKPFERLNAASDFPGSGLGLSICKRLADNMKGTIRFEDSKAEQGVALVLRFPTSGMKS